MSTSSAAQNLGGSIAESATEGEPSVSSVLDYLLGRGTPFLVLPHPDAMTAEETAASHGVAPGELVRTEIVIGRMGPSLMVVPATRYLRVELAQDAVGDAGARLATHAEIRAVAPGCDLGGVPPLSLYLLAPMFVDPAVAELPQVVFTAGRRSVLVCMEREELFRDDPYVVVPLTAESFVPERAVASSRRPVLRDEDLLPVHMAPAADDAIDVA